MSGERMVGLLSDLHNAHELLFEISVEKTETLKENDVNKLDTLLKEEEKTIQLIERIENDRISAVERLLNEKGIVADDNPSLGQLIRFYNIKEQGQLEELQEKLRETIERLQEQNELNNDLTRQSLQFVNASLSLMEPTQSTATYERTGQAKQTNSYEQRQSMFDSKA
ncbi:flagellar protein FlgN [Alkalihalobacillus sp. AL-G]|uniref:flagellar protein FlgN n=1 Tax=Alkalihalobacillus sp. AL-G TaxID=2926399 RepID=UPI00272D0FE6|nr:flagellar protein FlgN [Alkalihalobacillus sp. AL-G]WLD92976.1 flagellar protein FlgN [Alkalihalobacillus sp. AL-G]